MHVVGKEVLAPGISIWGNLVTLCPGCGLAALGVESPTDQDVTDWCIAAVAVLGERGLKGATEANAVRIAARYIRRPWHG